MLIYSETVLQYRHPQLWYFFCPLFYPHVQIMYWTVISPQTIACSSNRTSVPAHDVSHLTITSWIICPLKHMFYSSRTYGLPWSALRTIWSSQASFLDVFCLIRVIIVLVFCQNGVKKIYFFTFWVCCILDNYFWIRGVPASLEFSATCCRVSVNLVSSQESFHAFMPPNCATEALRSSDMVWIKFWEHVVND